MKTSLLLAGLAAAACLSAAPAFADAALGGTGIWKMVGANRYLMSLDWSYITNPDDDETQTYVLYDKDTANGTGVNKADYDGFTTASGCEFVVTGDDQAGTKELTVKDKDACGDDAVFAGHYKMDWDPENPR